MLFNELDYHEHCSGPTFYQIYHHRRLLVMVTLGLAGEKEYFGLT